MDKGSLPDLAAQLSGFFYALIPPSLWALLGRITHWAQNKKRPGWADIGREFIIVLFMGTVSGGAAEYLQIQPGAQTGAFIATMSYFGPKIIHVIVGKIIKKPDDAPCGLEINGRK